MATATWTADSCRVGRLNARRRVRPAVGVTHAAPSAAWCGARAARARVMILTSSGSVGSVDCQSVASPHEARAWSEASWVAASTPRSSVSGVVDRRRHDHRADLVAPTGRAFGDQLEARRT